MTDIRTLSEKELRNDLAAAAMEQRALEKLLPGAPADKRPEMEERIVGNGRVVAVIRAELERRETAVLISCSKKKANGAAPAGELYQGMLFRAQLAYARQVLGMLDEQIFVMSAQYGLLALHREIEPYDLMLAQLQKNERRQWGARVIGALEQAMPQARKVVLLAGSMYWEAVDPPLRVRGVAIDTAVPPGLGYAQQAAWFRTQVEAISNGKA